MDKQQDTIDERSYNEEGYQLITSARVCREKYSPYHLEKVWYGDYVFAPQSIQFNLEPGDPVVEAIVELIKRRVMDSFRVRPTIAQEMSMVRKPIKDDDCKRIYEGTIGWKAKLIWEDERDRPEINPFKDCMIFTAGYNYKRPEN